VLDANPRDDFERRAAVVTKRNHRRRVTSDGETFPVHRSLLRPCVALTRHVREAAARGHREQRKEGAVGAGYGDGGGDGDYGDVVVVVVVVFFAPRSRTTEPNASNPVDCERFDKVLLWLERESLGSALPEYDVRTAEALVGAAETLGLVSLADACRASRSGRTSAASRRTFGVTFWRTTKRAAFAWWWTAWSLTSSGGSRSTPAATGLSRARA